jgi:uncharacterized protein involved in outer membrane biogenesis
MPLPVVKWLKWTVGVFLVLTLALVVLLAFPDWNWLRGPIGRMVTEKTGRPFAINGDLKVKIGWPSARVQAGQLSFANPRWAQRQPMVSAENVDFTISLPELFRRRISLPDARVVRPAVDLELSPDGRKNWLLDVNQQNEQAVVRIDRLVLDQGHIRFDDPAKKTSIEADVRSLGPAEGTAGTAFTASGRYLGLPLKASGRSGPVLGLRDQTAPYPLTVEASIGDTAVKADGRITGLVALAAIDMQIAVSGDSLDRLYPLIGIALPETRPYRTSGHLLHDANTWRYEKFSGRVGSSDIGGDMRVDLGGVRPFLRGNVVSDSLNFADLGPVIGAKPKPSAPAATPARKSARRTGASKIAATKAERADPGHRADRADPADAASEKEAPPAERRPAESGASGRVLPDTPFRIERWPAADADVSLRAKNIRRPEALPIDNLVTRIQMRDAVLTLDPLSFGVAGGTLAGSLSLDGRQSPIQVRAKLAARRLQLSRLFPTLDLAQVNRGRASGEIDVAASGDSVARMLGSANGKAALVVDGGRVSQFAMEAVGLHLWEMLSLKVTGDKPINLRCVVADFSVKDGVLHSNTLLFDSEVTTVLADGKIDLGKEKLDLTLTQRTKDASPVSLRSPIYVRGTFANPDVSIDKSAVATRSAGAVALGLINPLLALVPLIETGPGMDSGCGQLIREAKKPAQEKELQPGVKRRQ